MTTPPPDDGDGNGPGCGMAVYAIGLLSVALIALIVLAVSSWAVLTQAERAVPMDLIPGTDVPVWRLQPLRDAGVIGITEIPMGWHDESPDRDGTTACAVMTDRLVRVEGGEGATLTWEASTGVSSAPAGEGVAVTVSGEGGAITCTFGPGQGGEHLARQIQAELSR